MTHDRLSTLQVICTESWGFTMEGTEMNQNSHFCKHSIQKAHQALINTLPDTQQDTLITQAVCSRVSGPEQQALMRASDFFFFFFDISFLQVSLLIWNWKVPLPHLHTWWKQMSPKGVQSNLCTSAAWQKCSRALQILLQSLEEPWEVDKVQRGFLSCSYSKEKVLVTKLEKNMALPSCWQHAIDRLIIYWQFFPFFFLSFAYSSNFNTIVQKRRDGKIVFLCKWLVKKQDVSWKIPKMT